MSTNKILNLRADQRKLVAVLVKHIGLVIKPCIFITDTLNPPQIQGGRSFRAAID